jgi:hypothetical protein
MAMTRDISGEDADLAIGDLARRSRVLARDTTRRLALLEEPGFINDQNRIRVAQRLKRVVAYHVTQLIGIPPPATKNSLLAPGSGVTRNLRPHPAGLAPFIPQQAVQKLRRRKGNPLLSEKGSYPRFDIP